MSEGYNEVANQLLLQREPMEFPPFGFLAVLRAEAPSLGKPLAFLELAADLVRGFSVKGVRLLGPAPSAMPKKAGRYRAECLLQSTDRRVLHQVLFSLNQALVALPAARHVRWSIDVDPVDTF